jgi:nitrite reductase/ring-hydroxylating ferredoxin subunit
MQWNDHDNAPERGTTLCAVDEIANDSGKELVIGGEGGEWPFRMFVVRRGDDVWGYVNACPHQHIPLNYFPDRFVSQDEQFIQCANHGALFNFDDGYCVSGPCAGQTLQPVPLTVRNGTLEIG